MISSICMTKRLASYTTDGYFQQEMFLKGSLYYHKKN